MVENMEDINISHQAGYLTDLEHQRFIEESKREFESAKRQRIGELREALVVAPLVSADSNSTGLQTAVKGNFIIYITHILFYFVIFFISNLFTYSSLFNTIGSFAEPSNSASSNSSSALVPAPSPVIVNPLPADSITIFISTPDGEKVTIRVKTFADGDKCQCSPLSF